MICCTVAAIIGTNFGWGRMMITIFISCAMSNSFDNRVTFQVTTFGITSLNG